jgi:hypothetical protein
MLYKRISMNFQYHLLDLPVHAHSIPAQRSDGVWVFNYVHPCFLLSLVAPGAADPRDSGCIGKGG